jgi:hypothetical protein
MSNDKRPTRENMPASSHPSKEGPLRHRATRFDGNPNQVPSEDSPSGLKPRDDTPAVLDKKEGPRKPGSS